MSVNVIMFPDIRAETVCALAFSADTYIYTNENDCFRRIHYLGYCVNLYVFYTMIVAYD